MGMTEIYLSLGSNLGDRQGNLDKAIEMLSDALGVQPEAVSQVIETEPWGFDSKNKFLNMCVLYSVALPEDILAEMAARGLLYEAKRIERWMGREKSGPGYEDRPIDIDILYFDDIALNEKDLIIPHPRIAERDFVKIPLREIAKPALRAAYPEIFNYISTSK